MNISLYINGREKQVSGGESTRFAEGSERVRILLTQIWLFLI